MEIYFTINVRLITHSVDIETENVMTSILFLSISPQSTLTAHVGVGYLARVGYLACNPWQEVVEDESHAGQEPVQGRVYFCEGRIWSYGP